MAKQKPTLAKGVRDFSPSEMARRNYIFDTIRQVYTLYGYRQIETPAMENLSTLLGKYGDEGDKLLFRILNSGDIASGLPAGGAGSLSGAQLSALLAEKGLRYDLTVPFARYVVMHRNEIVFPFNRYQIQPVWRADRPQKGRYREFYQCDADVIGSDSLLNECELVEIVDRVFCRLGLKVCIKINNRKLLAGIADWVGAPDQLVTLTVAIDKIDKIGLEKVCLLLQEQGFSADAIERLKPLLLIEGDNDAKLALLKKTLGAQPQAAAGIAEIETVLRICGQANLQNQVELDISLARGLNYYTGAIIEVKSLEVGIGSIAGGGRYDNLTGIFGLDNVSGVGISFGADRIYDVLLQLERFPQQVGSGAKVLFTNLGEAELQYVLPVARKLREMGVAVEIYPQADKLKKQLSYADSLGIACTVIAGEAEMAEGAISLKDMVSGEQRTFNIPELFQVF
jgi:histidyl-tRNA synthetase